MPTKKEINRFSKKELIAICKDNGITCNSKTSKISLVAEVMKNKSLRGSLTIKPKRKMSEKQIQNLAKHRFNKASLTKEQDDSAVVRKPFPAPVSISIPVKNSNKDIKATASNKNEEVPNSLKQNISKSVAQGTVAAENTPKEPMQPIASITKFEKEKEKITDFKTGEKKGGKVLPLQITSEKKFRDKASLNAEKLHQGLSGTVFDANRSSLDNHTSRLRNRMNVNRSIISVEKKELGVGQMKSTDVLDRKIFDRVSKKNKKQIALAEQRALHKQDRIFDGDLDEAGDIDFGLEIGKDLTQQDRLQMLLSLQSSLKAGIINQEEYNRELQRFTQAQEEKSRVIPQQNQRQQRIGDLQKRLNDLQEKKKAPLKNNQVEKP